MHNSSLLHAREEEKNVLKEIESLKKRPRDANLDAYYFWKVHQICDTADDVKFS